MSSTSPIETRQFAARINELGCEYLDAPLSGGEAGAREASLSIMVGGPGAAFEKAKPWARRCCLRAAWRLISSGKAK
jgi:2-hydroxy-3-oxopropionate reductase